ncbi:hypothetical protein RHMOL_Rhmol05G0045100 [Rhododendron molle]|uniref:Uncharacterized protein n=1 Tax=Rhododendron molle TaxID=49168 RepID=A0ACC0NKN2_RHOML|nr:hypothetical protein RHMOL_Rhmol05G0045100 [Rhododendron molle]
MGAVDGGKQWESEEGCRQLKNPPDSICQQLEETPPGLAARQFQRVPYGKHLLVLVFGALFRGRRRISHINLNFEE